MQPTIVPRDDIMNFHAYRPQDISSMSTLISPFDDLSQLAFDPSLAYTNRVLDWVRRHTKLYGDAFRQKMGYRAHGTTNPSSTYPVLSATL